MALDKIVAFLRSEWQVISTAPFLFIAALTVVGILLWRIFTWAHGREIASLKAEAKSKDVAIPIEVRQPTFGLMDNVTKGLHYLNQAAKALSRDFQVAFEDEDWNIAVRRAQESMEFAVKAVFLLAGEQPPEDGGHSPGLRKLLSRLLPIPFLRQDAISDRGPFRIRRHKSSGGIGLSKVIRGVETQFGYIEPDTSDPLVLRIDYKERIVTLSVGDRLRLSSTDFPVGKLDLTPSRDELKRIQRYVSHLAQLRNPAFYFDELLTKQGAEEARKQAQFVLASILRFLGIQ